METSYLTQPQIPLNFDYGLVPYDVLLESNLLSIRYEDYSLYITATIGVNGYTFQFDFYDRSYTLFALPYLMDELREILPQMSKLVFLSIESYDQEEKFLSFLLDRLPQSLTLILLYNTTVNSAWTVYSNLIIKIYCLECKEYYIYEFGKEHYHDEYPEGIEEMEGIETD